MATKTVTTYVHTCDLCGEPREEDELTQFQMPAGGTSRNLRLDTEAGADVCGGCLSRPVSDVKAFIEAEMGRKGLKLVRVRLTTSGGTRS